MDPSSLTPFSHYPELFPNAMIQFGPQLSHLSYLEYQSEMIQKFYPNADINMINQMTEWAQQPLMKLITVNTLTVMLIDTTTKRFKQLRVDRILTQEETNSWQCVLNQLHNATTSPLGSATLNWLEFVKLTRSRVCMPGSNNNKYHEHVYFVDLIQPIWTTNQSARMNKSISDMQVALIRSSQAVTDLQAEVDRLKQKNADLSYQVQITAYSLAVLQPANPVYDYHEIKSRKQKLHSEFKRMSKLMKLGK
jgi:hypothetical protein